MIVSGVISQKYLSLVKRKRSPSHATQSARIFWAAGPEGRKLREYLLQLGKWLAIHKFITFCIKLVNLRWVNVSKSKIRR